MRRFSMLATDLLSVFVAGAISTGAVAGVRPDGVDMPAVSGRGAYVAQIGHADEARVSQSAPNASAVIRQEGERNRAAIDQRGDGSAHAEIVQTGDFNQAAAIQRGDGQNALYLTQAGTENRAVADQNATGALYNGAIMTQTGQRNEMILTQDGNDNRAVLAQDGNDNLMTAAQQGEGNRLVWTQQGAGLPTLGIMQTGAQAVQISQTGGQ